MGRHPVDGANVYVNGSYTGGGSDGSMQMPWTTISDAVAAAAPRALIAVAAGSYLEDVVVNKPVRLWGVCPEHVELVGTAVEFGALTFLPGSGGSEARGLAITGDRLGVFVAGATDIVLEQLWVHDALSRGMNIQNSHGATSVTLTRSLIEENHELGVFVAGAEATLAGLVIRRTQPRASDQEDGGGINIQLDPNTGAPSTVNLTSSVLEQNHEVGVRVAGSEAMLEGLVVRGTMPRVSDQQVGRGINIQAAPITGARSTAFVKSSLVEENHEHGVVVLGSEATLEGLLVRRTLPRVSDKKFGRGIGLQRDFDIGVLSTTHVKSSVVDENHDLGVVVIASEATLEGVVVRATQLQASSGLFGDGFAVDSVILQGERLSASAIVTQSRVQDNVRAGVASFGAHLALGASALSCNAIDLDAEMLGDMTHTFENLGGTRAVAPGRQVSATRSRAVLHLPRHHEIDASRSCPSLPGAAYHVGVGPRIGIVLAAFAIGCGSDDEPTAVIPPLAAAQIASGSAKTASA